MCIINNQHKIKDIFIVGDLVTWLTLNLDTSIALRVVLGLHPRYKYLGPGSVLNAVLQQRLVWSRGCVSSYDGLTETLMKVVCFSPVITTSQALQVPIKFDLHSSYVSIHFCHRRPQ